MGEMKEGERPNQEQIKNLKKTGVDCDNSFRKRDSQEQTEHCEKHSRQQLCKLTPSYGANTKRAWA